MRSEFLKSSFLNVCLALLNFQYRLIMRDNVLPILCYPQYSNDDLPKIFGIFLGFGMSFSVSMVIIPIGFFVLGVYRKIFFLKFPQAIKTPGLLLCSSMY